jgi:hypothetical protein
MTKPCEMCNENPAVKTQPVQTMPGSFDTKFYDVEMCQKCLENYHGLLDHVWEGKVNHG